METNEIIMNEVNEELLNGVKETKTGKGTLILSGLLIAATGLFMVSSLNKKRKEKIREVSEQIINKKHKESDEIEELVEDEVTEEEQ